jgi:hypothetical protein
LSFFSLLLPYPNFRICFYGYRVRNHFSFSVTEIYANQCRRILVVCGSSLIIKAAKFAVTRLL